MHKSRRLGCCELFSSFLMHECQISKGKVPKCDGVIRKCGPVAARASPTNFRGFSLVCNDGVIISREYFSWGLFVSI